MFYVTTHYHRELKHSDIDSDQNYYRVDLCYVMLCGLSYVSCMFIVFVIDSVLSFLISNRHLLKLHFFYFTQLVLTNSPKGTIKRKQKTASVTIALIEARELDNEPASEEKSRIVCCRFRLVFVL